MRAKSDFPSINEKKQLGLKADRTQYKVMIVDDSLFVSKQTEQILASEEFEIVAKAENGADALERYKELYPNIDLVTMDITMPKMDGIAALEKIMDFDKDAKVIMVTALGKQDLVKKSLMLGAKNYNAKMMPNCTRKIRLSCAYLAVVQIYTLSLFWMLKCEVVLRHPQDIFTQHLGLDRGI